MKRIKQILIGVFISILLIPMITNNVYAKTVTLTWQGAGATTNTIKYAKVYDVDFSMINSAEITCSMSSPGDTGMRGYAIFKACSTTGDVLTSKTLNLTTHNGSANGSINLNLSTITGQGYFECEYKGQYFRDSGWDYNGPFSISNITAQYIDKPVFSGDFGSGNLNPVDLNLTNGGSNTTYSISASNTTSLGMKIDGGEEQIVTGADGKFIVSVDKLAFPTKATGACKNNDADTNCDKCGYPMGKGSCHTIQFFAHGSNGDTTETSVGTFCVDYTPVYSQGLEDEDKYKSTVENSVQVMTSYANFPKNDDGKVPGYYLWQYRLYGTDSWVDINDSTAVDKEGIISLDGKPHAINSIFSVSPISGNKSSSRLSIKAVSTAMDKMQFRCLLKSGITYVSNSEESAAEVYTLRVLPSQYKYFSNIQRTESIGTEVYDNSMLYLTYADENGGDGAQLFVHGNLRNDFVNPVNKQPYFNIIRLDADCLKTGDDKHDDKYKKLWGIGNGKLSSDGTNVKVSYEGDAGLEDITLDEVLVKDVKDVTNVTREERDMMIRRVIGDTKVLDACTEKENDSTPLTIKAGKNIIISYLSPFRTCADHMFIDANSDTKCDKCDNKESACANHTFIDANLDKKCDTCGCVDYEDIDNYVFAITPVTGIDMEAPVVKDIVAKWIAKDGQSNFYEDGAEFKQGLNGTHNTPLSGSVNRPFQDLKLFAEIKDNCVALEGMNVKWYHAEPGNDKYIEFEPTCISTLKAEDGKEYSVLTIPGLPANNGTYKVEVIQKDNEALKAESLEFDVGNIWDNVEPEFKKVTVSPSDDTYAQYREIQVVATDTLSGLDENPYTISSKSLSEEELADDRRWNKRNTFTVDKEGDYYVYVRDYAGCIAANTIHIANIDHTAPCIAEITTEKVSDGDDATVRATIHATDNCQQDADLLFYKAYWICEDASSGYDIGEKVPVTGDFSHDKTFIAARSGYYMLYVKDDAGNIASAQSSYIDVNFITGKLGDIVNSGEGDGFVDKEGGFTDKKGGFKDETGGFTDKKGGFTDGFIDEKGGFVDTEGGFVNKNGFIDKNGFKDNGFIDNNGFIDEKEFVDLNGFVDKTHYHDYKGDTSEGDTHCDNCGMDNASCKCEGGFVDSEKPDGKCDGCNVEEVNKANCTCGPDGKCDTCGFEHKDCTCAKDNTCDKCGNEESACTDTNPDTLCDKCYQKRGECSCGPDGKCDTCGNEQSACNCTKDKTCDKCGFDATYCTCPKDQLCDNCGLDREHCTCEIDSYCDKCGEREAECMCGDGICDRCENDEEHCGCKDGLCDVCKNPESSCICKDGACDTCGKSEEQCDCKDGLCDKCGQDEEHCKCVDGLCDVCKKDKDHCDCKDGLCDKCGEDEEHCTCPDGLCDKCGKDKDNCRCVGVSVKLTRTPLSFTNGKSTFHISATMNTLDANPFSWDGGNTWSADTEYIVEENGDYFISVKDKHGNIYTHKETVSNIDKDIPYLTGALDKTTNTIKLQASDTSGGSGLYKITYFYQQNSTSLRTEERVVRLFDENQFSSDNDNFYVEEAGTYIFRVYDRTEATAESAGKDGEGNYYELQIDTLSSDLSTTNPDVSTDKEVMKGYITASTEDWTTENVILTLNMSDEGLATRPYCWNGKDWVTTPFITVEENCTVTLRVKDKQGHIFEAAPYEVTNIDKTAPEFTVNYSATNGNFVEVSATDEGSGIASIYWQGGSITSLTKALEVMGAPNSGSFSIQVPVNGQYRVWVIDVAGNGYLMDNSKTFKATSVTAQTNDESNTGSTNTTTTNNGLSDAQYKGLLNAINALGNKQTSSGGTTNNYYTTTSGGSSGSSGSSASTTKTPTTSSVGNVGKIQSSSTTSDVTSKTVSEPVKTTTTSSSTSKVATATSKPNAVTSSSSTTTVKPKVTTLSTTEKKDENADVEDADIAAMSRNSRIQGVEATADQGAKKGINIILAIFVGLIAIGGIGAGIYYYNKKHGEYSEEFSDDMEFDEERLTDGDSEE